MARSSAAITGKFYALRWTATEPGGLSNPYNWLGKAQNWEEFRSILKKVWGPGQNALYADVEGNIGYVMAARVPIRKKPTAKFPRRAKLTTTNGPAISLRSTPASTESGQRLDRDGQRPRRRSEIQTLSHRSLGRAYRTARSTIFFSTNTACVQLTC